MYRSCSSPLVARFYHRPELQPVTALLALSVVLDGVGVQHDAVLRRHVRFGGLAVAAIASQLVNLAVAVGLASAGAGYWALVCGALAASFTLSLLTFGLCPWLPTRFKRGTAYGTCSALA